MIKKISTLLMVIFIFTSQAEAASGPGLKSAIDELNYSLSVEWDQKDAAFYEARIAEFKDTVKTLRANGLSDSELIEFVKSQTTSDAFANDVETAFSLVRLNQMSTEEATAFLMNSMGRTYKAGASWSGLTSAYIASGAVIIIIALIFIAVPTKNRGPKCYTVTPYCSNGVCSDLICD